MSQKTAQSKVDKVSFNLEKASDFLSQKFFSKVKHREEEIEKQNENFVNEHGAEILCFLYEYLERSIEKSPLEDIKGHLYVRHSEMILVSSEDNVIIEENNSKCLTHGKLTTNQAGFHVMRNENSDSMTLMGRDFITYSTVKNIENISYISGIAISFFESCKLKVTCRRKNDIIILDFSG